MNQAKKQTNKHLTQDSRMIDSVDHQIKTSEVMATSSRIAIKGRRRQM